MSLLMNTRTSPAGTTAKSFDLVSMQEIHIYNNDIGLNFEFHHDQFREVVKCYLTGENNWIIPNGKTYFACSSDFASEMMPMPPGECRQRNKLTCIGEFTYARQYDVEQLLGWSLEPSNVISMVYIGDVDFNMLVDYWMTNTQIRPKDARLVLLEEIKQITPASFAEDLHNFLLSLQFTNDGPLMLENPRGYRSI